jgi:hypothetical protein
MREAKDSDSVVGGWVLALRADFSSGVMLRHAEVWAGGRRGCGRLCEVPSHREAEVVDVGRVRREVAVGCLGLCRAGHWRVEVSCYGKDALQRG